MSQQAFGWNVHLRYLKNPGGLVKKIAPFRPASLTVMVDDKPGAEDQTKYIVELARQMPETLIAARVKHDHDGGYHTKPVNHPAYYIASPVDVLNKWGHLGVDNMTLYLLNEPGGGVGDPEIVKRLNDWCVEVMDRAAERGISVTLPNFGTGQPALGTDGAWHPAFDPILRGLSKHRGLHFLGVHEYAPDRTYRVNRYKRVLKRCATLGIEPPRIIITEWGVDKGDGGDQTLNGYKSRKWSGTFYIHTLVEQLKVDYGADIEAGIIAGLHVFSLGDSGGWSAFDVEEDQGFWNELSRAQERGDLPMTKRIRQYVPKPENARIPQVVKVLKARNLRSGPGTHFNDDGDITSGTVVTLYDMPALRDAEARLWKWVEITPEKGGWIAVADGVYENVKPLPHDPPTEEVPTLPAPPQETFPDPAARERVLKITVTATDDEWAQVSTVALSALEALRKLAGLSEPIQAILPRIKIEDMSS